MYGWIYGFIREAACRYCFARPTACVSIPLRATNHMYASADSVSYNGKLSILHRATDSMWSIPLRATDHIDASARSVNTALCDQQLVWGYRFTRATT